MGFNTNTKNEPEWLTPKYIIDALRPFDLDPCAPPIERRPWNTATNHFSKEVDGDGLVKEWQGRVWLNPPYGRETFKWLAKLAIHASGIALIFARTETIGFHNEVWKKADSIFFFKGRLSFGITGTGEIKDRCNAPSCLVSYCDADTDIIKKAHKAGKISGFLVVLKDRKAAQQVDEGLRNCENCEYGCRLDYEQGCECELRASEVCKTNTGKADHADYWK